jgi:hypothetical protein
VKHRIVSLIADLIEAVMATGETRTYAAADAMWERAKDERAARAS